MKKLLFTILFCLTLGVFVNAQNQTTSKSSQPGSSSITAKKKRTIFRPTKKQLMEVQTNFRAEGKFQGEVTGKYSKEFREAIKNYQSANGLKRKGSLNRATLEKMRIELTDKQKNIPVNPKDFAKANNGKTGKKRKAVFRASRTQISQVQKMLREKGLYDGEETGKLNPATRSAIKEWQSQNKVKKTGTLNKATLEAMGIVLTEKQKAF